MAEHHLDEVDHPWYEDKPTHSVEDAPEAILEVVSWQVGREREAHGVVGGVSGWDVGQLEGLRGVVVNEDWMVPLQSRDEWRGGSP